MSRLLVDAWHLHSMTKVKTKANETNYTTYKETEKATKRHTDADAKTHTHTEKNQDAYR